MCTVEGLVYYVCPPRKNIDTYHCVLQLDFFFFFQKQFYFSTPTAGLSSGSFLPHSVVGREISHVIAERRSAQLGPSRLMETVKLVEEK